MKGKYGNSMTGAGRRNGKAVERGLRRQEEKWAARSGEVKTYNLNDKEKPRE